MCPVSGRCCRLKCYSDFFLYLFVFNRYSLRLEAMLQKEEFQITLETIEPSIEALKGAIEGVQSVR